MRVSAPASLERFDWGVGEAVFSTYQFAPLFAPPGQNPVLAPSCRQVAAIRALCDSPMKSKEVAPLSNIVYSPFNPEASKQDASIPEALRPTNDEVKK